jgi:hypothetical protein
MSGTAGGIGRRMQPLIQKNKVILDGLLVTGYLELYIG